MNLVILMTSIMQKDSVSVLWANVQEQLYNV